MKATLALALLLSVAPLPASATDTAFDPNEKISIDVKEAQIADFVTTLAAMANMPVSIDANVSGTITLKMDNAPFAKVLTLIQIKTGVSVRIDNGKLLASRPGPAVSAASPAAPMLPEQFREAPRTRVADVAKSSPTIPVFVRTKWNGGQSCHRLDFIEGKRPTISFRVGKDESTPLISVTQFAFDPVSRLRYLLLDGAGLVGSTAVVGGGRVTSLDHMSESESLSISVAEREGADCKTESLRETPPGRPSELFFSTREIGSVGPGVRVMAPNIRLTTGTAFKLRTGLNDEKTGQQRELVLSGYLSHDGQWVAVHFMATAIWTDPLDGIEYLYTQSSEVALVPVTLKGVVAATIPAGVAAPKALELTVLGPDGMGGPAAPSVQNDATARP